MINKSYERSQGNRKKRRKPNAAQTRKIILDAALEVFLEKGFTGATVDEIAKKASVAKGTIFFHFESKLKLLLQVFLSLSKVEEDFSQLEEKYQNGFTIEDCFKYAARKTFEHAEEKATLRRLWMLEALRLKGNEGFFYRELIQKPVAPIEEFIKRREKEGVLRDLDPYIVAMGFLGSLFSFRLWHEIMQGNIMRPLSYEKLGEQITDLFLHGLRTNKNKD